MSVMYVYAYTPYVSTVWTTWQELNKAEACHTFKRKDDTFINNLTTYPTSSNLLHASKWILNKHDTFINLLLLTQFRYASKLELISWHHINLGYSYLIQFSIMPTLAPQKNFLMSIKTEFSVQHSILNHFFQKIEKKVFPVLALSITHWVRPQARKVFQKSFRYLLRYLLI
jgi:hypothetical protein